MDIPNVDLRGLVLVDLGSGVNACPPSHAAAAGLVPAKGTEAKLLTATGARAEQMGARRARYESD
eukprot:5786010-Alexandrium_andersonii.AAC.1